MQEKVSFTQDIKEELTMNDYTENEVRSILAAFIRISGTLSFSKASEKLTLKTENAKIAKFVYKLISLEFPNAIISFSFVKVMKLYKATTYLINITQGATNVIRELNIDFLNSKIPYELHNKDEKIKGYLVGTFLACGSCNDPKTSNYHFEFALNDEEYAHSISKIINKVKISAFNFKVIKRRNKYVLYLKRSDQISTFLAYLDANNSCLEFENIRMDRDFSNVNNRLMNCDSYNFKKTLDIANQQIEYINIVDSKLGIDNIQNVKLKTLCKLRQENIEANYNELASLMSDELDEAISKSNINHLFIKLKKMAQELSDENRGV